MKRISLPVLLAAAAAVQLAGGCRKPEPTPEPVVVQEDTKRVEREALFGPEALQSDVQWRDSGLGCRILTEGTPPKPGLGQTVRIRYAGRLKDGTVFDRADQPAAFVIGGTITGLSNGLQMLGTGGKAVFFIPPSQGYGARKVMGIPPNSGLIFEVEVVEVLR